MKIGVISDTHIGNLSEGVELLELLDRELFHDAEAILHAGDVVHPDLLDCFADRPIIGVRGNCDQASTGLPQQRVCEFADFRIGLIHGWGRPTGFFDNIVSAFDGYRLDVLVFGHTYFPLCRRQGELLLFSPGSAIDRREAPYHTVGILHLDKDVRGEIVNIDRYLNVMPEQYGGCA